MLQATALSAAAAMTQSATQAAQAAPAARNPADARLASFLDAEWTYSLKRYPEFASSQGDRSGDDRWDDVSLDAQSSDLAQTRDALVRLERIDRQALSDPARLDYDLYAQQLRDAIDGFSLRTYLFAVNQRGGVQTDSTIVDLLPFESARDYEALLARIASWPRKVDQTLDVLSEAVRRGYLWPKVVMTRVVAQVDRLDVAPEAHPLFAPFKTISTSVPAADAARLRETARDGIRRFILPAQAKFKAFMTGTYLPAAPERVGLDAIPDGAALYAYFLRTNTTTSLGAERIRDIGLTEVARIRAEMEATAPLTGYPGSLHEVFVAMRTDPANYHKSETELLEAYRALAKRIDPHLVEILDPLPRQPYGVFPIPDAIAPDATTAYYQPGSLDGLRAGGMHCNLYKPETRPIYEMPVLTLHEAVPGHHIQFALQNELGALPNFRRVGYYVGFSEGWALYAESLGERIGVYDSPKTKLGAQSYDMWRAVRLVVDTGMHAFGWTRERAIAYFLENTPKSELDVTNEIDRYITDPGQACAYKIGQMRILELRARARARLGPKFDLRGFHAAILEAGSIPLDILDKRVETWLANREARSKQ